VERSTLSQLLDEQHRDQKAAEDKEDVHAEEAAARPERRIVLAKVKGKNGQDRDCADAVKSRPATEREAHQSTMFPPRDSRAH
jgi:hypothetical protein